MLLPRLLDSRSSLGPHRCCQRACDHGHAPGRSELNSRCQGIGAVPVRGPQGSPGGWHEGRDATEVDAGPAGPAMTGLTRGSGPVDLPRKEVIQPQLPLRLPCYDFTPITDPTFDGSLPCGLGHRLRVLPTFVV